MVFDSWGRYTQPDPIGLRGGANLFGYGLQNPMRWIDPEGLKVRRCCRPSNSLDPFGMGAVGQKFDHCWISTDKHTVGYGPAGGGCSQFLTKVIDHTNEMSKTTTKCEDLNDVDEDCLNKAIEEQKDKTTGLFVPGINDCREWVNRRTAECPKKKCKVFPTPFGPCGTTVDGRIVCAATGI